MRRFALISTLLLASWINQNLIAQAHLSWKYARLTAGMDTVGRLSDSAELSRTLYTIAYGSTDKRFPNQLLKTIDSARIGQAVGRILKDTSQWKLQVLAIEPLAEPYRELRKTVDSISLAGSDSLLQWQTITHALNEYRIINRLAGQMIALVNIPSATLRVLDPAGRVILKCKVIVGSPRTPTPIFAANLTRIITYPYWNVPRSIAVKEFLPKIKKDPTGFLDAMKMQVISPKGKLISPEMIDWKNLSAKNFPYRLRQSTGCDNALGVIKFDLDSPYDVYLHDTNHRELFSKKYRFLSHGCIRVAEPIKLANLLMGKEWLSDAFTEGRYNNLPSKSYPLPNTVPVVITYTLVEADAGLVYYQDIYKALANKSITYTR
ncbi:L,D-transpeptidase family protein [Dyadobacter bucti]|uniref:L,D-transpeptidase family protein n=1 Tax=Dyadobacter bucti TaxID=2572203 RepID=UPI003F7085F4